jgi:flagellar biosynthesis anti-sigma factor FlgM
MKKPTKRGPTGAPTAPKGKGRKHGSRSRPPRPGVPTLQGDDGLIEQVRQIVDETPDIRPEKVDPLREAVASGTYEVDARKVANSLITKIILES